MSALKSTPEPIDRAPELRPGSLAAAVVAFATVVAALEVFAAARGIVARPADGVGAWARMYRRALEDDGGIALLGSSRTALGVDPSVLSEAAGRPVHNLSIDGGNPIPVLRRLDVDGYRGVVLVEVIERRFFSDDERGHTTVRPYLAELDNPSLVAGLEDLARVRAAEAFRSRSAPMQLLAILRSAMSGTLPGPASRYNRPDRFEFTDVSQVDGSELEARWAAQSAAAIPLPDSGVALVLSEMAGIEDRLESRGASVRWFRMPTSGEVQRVEDAMFPRASTFERLGDPDSRWHYADDPRTSSLTCFDGSHLGPDDARVLSRVLGEWLVARTDGEVE